MGMKQFFKDKGQHIQEELQRRRELRKKITKIRIQGEEERVLKLETERQKVKTEVKLRAIRDKGKPLKAGAKKQQNTGLGFLQNMADNLASSKPIMGGGFGLQSESEPEPNKKKRKKRRKQKPKKTKRRK